MKRAPKKKDHTRGLGERPSWMRLAMENTRDAVFWVESSGNIAHVNAAACASLGYSKNQLTALSVFDIDPNFSRDRWPEHWKQTHKKKSLIIETVHKRKDGTTFPVDVTITTINFHGKEYHCSVARDITKRTEMEKELHERVVLAQFTAEFSKILAGEGELRSLLQRCAQLMVETFDAAFARIWTLNEKELMLELQASAGLYTHLDGAHGKVPIGRFKIGIIAKKRKPHLTNSVTDDPHVSDREWAQREGMVAFAGYPLLVDDKVVGVMAMFARHPLAETHIQAMAAVSHVLATTIERKRAEAALLRANRALRTLGECNQAIVRAINEDQLLREVCDLIVRFGGYRMAWVGLAQNDEGRSVEPVAQAGFDDGYIASADISWAETERGRGPTGTAIRERRTVTARCIQTDAQFAAWREAALRRGFASSIALPLLIDNTSCMGALNIYSGAPDAFDGDEEKLLTDLTSDIVYGIRALRDRAAKEVAVENVRSTAERLSLALQAANQGIYDLNIQTGAAQVSAEYATMLGYAPVDFRETNESWIERLHPDDREPVTAVFRDYIAAKIPEYRVEFRQRTLSGNWKWILSLGKIVARQSDGRPLRMLGTHTDITERKKVEEALVESQNHLQSIIRNAPVILFGLDAHGVFTFSDGKGLEALGLKPGEVVGQSALELYRDFPPVVEAVERALSGEVLSAIHDMGRWVFDVAYTPLKDQQGQIMGLIGVATDITERKRAEEALLKSEEKFARAFRASPDIIVLTSLIHGRIVEVNERFYRATGYSREEIIGKRTTELHFWADQAERDHYMSLLTRDGHVHDLETKFRIKSGEIRDAVLSGEIIDLRDGKHILGVIRDTTEQRRIEQALRESEERFRTTLYSIGDAVITTDTEGSIMQMNRVAENMTGWKESEAQGKPIQQVFLAINEDTGEWIEGPVACVLRESRAITLAHHTVLVSRDGTWRPIGDSASPIRNERGKTIGVVLVFNDQTEQRHLQAQLMQSQKLEAVGRLAGGVAHDFNNMIGVILGYSKLMEDKLEPENPLRKNVDTITTAAERSANLTKQLLAFARKQVVTPVALNLNDSLASLHKMLSRLIGEDIALNVNPGKDIWNIKIDPTQVDQILANLSTNARDAIENIGSIVIETSNETIDEAFCKEHLDFVPGEYVLLTFADDGKGMDEATLARVFEPFFTTKPKGTGTGLGLATIFGIVRQNGGHIIPTSEEGKGTTFSIYFPRHYGPTEILGGKKETDATRGTETIFVVEDEEQLLDLTKSALEHYGYKVLGAQSPDKAIRICKQARLRIDMLITDVVMPGMNGKELKEQIDKIRPGLKTIYMSGYTADVVAHRGVLDEGINFLQKPFTPNTLAKKVREVLDRTAP